MEAKVDFLDLQIVESVINFLESDFEAFNDILNTQNLSAIGIQRAIASSQGARNSALRALKAAQKHLLKVYNSDNTKEVYSEIEIL